MSNLSLLYPQLILIAGILVVLVAGMRPAGTEPVHRRIVFLGLAFLAATACACCWHPGDGDIGGVFRADAFSRFFAVFAALASAITLVLASRSEEISLHRFPEFAAILLITCLGISVMAAAQDLLMAYVAMETVSLSCYVLTGFRRTHPISHEAALKYVIYGSVASGIMIFGMSMLYGLSGGTSFAGIAGVLAENGEVVQAGPIGLFAFTVAWIFVLAGLCFKIAAVPFHMWCPDVYQGAPTPFTGFLSVATKGAGFALLVRFLAGLFPHAQLDIQGTALAILGLVAVVTMTLGNLTALHQTSAKRLLAYSSIAHAGYILLGVVAFDTAGASAMLIYLAIYLLMNLGAFGAVQILSDRVGSEEIEAFRGLGYRAPFLAACLAVFLFSLAGIPPTAGFIGKFLLFAAVIETGKFWYVLLAVAAILNSAIAFFYYARILQEMYLRRQPTEQPAVNADPVSAYVLAALLLPLLFLGVYWEPLRVLANAAAASLGL